MYSFNDSSTTNVKTNKDLLHAVGGVVQDSFVIVFWSPATRFYLLLCNDLFSDLCPIPWIVLLYDDESSII